LQSHNAVKETSLRNPTLVWSVGCAAAAVILASTLPLAFFRNNLALRAAIMAAGMFPAAFVVCRLVPGGAIDHTNRRRVLFAVMAIHVLATLYFFPISDIFNDRPVVTLDHSFHYYQAVRTREVFWDTFRFDRYDPFFMAGYPGGTIFDLDMKGAETVCALTPGVGVARALKLFILCAYLSMIPVMYWGSRMQGFRIRESVLGLLIFLAYWHWGRPYAGDFRYAGMFSFVFGAHLCFLLVGLLRKVARGAFIKTFLGLGPLAFLIHPTAVVMLPVPFAAAIGVDRRLWGQRKWLLLALWCFLVLFINSPWLIPFFDYVWMKTTTELYYQIAGWGGLMHVVCRPSCAIAIAMIALSVVGVVRMSVERRLSAGLPAAAGAVFLFCAAGFGRYSPGLSQLEPGRFLFAGFVFLAPLAGAGAKWVMETIAGALTHDKLRRAFRCAVIVGLVLAVLPLSLLESKAYYRHTLTTELTPKVASLVDAVSSTVSPPGRLMIEDCPAVHYGDVHLPALLPLITGVEQIGGPYPHTFLLYYFTSFRWEETFGRPMDQWDRASLQPYLALYDVRWILTATARSTRFMSDLLGAPPVWSRPPYSLWTLPDEQTSEGKLSQTVTASGAGRPDVRAATNRLEIHWDGSLDGYFIGYHWVPGLAVDGAATIRPLHKMDDPVPFIYVEPNGDDDITVSY
jgi:hypothetical protein